MVSVLARIFGRRSKALPPQTQREVVSEGPITLPVVADESGMVNSSAVGHAVFPGDRYVDKYGTPIRGFRN